MRITTSIVCCLTVALAACASSLGPLKVQPGQSEADVVRLAGQPRTVYKNPDGSRQLEYNNQPFGTTVYMITVGANGQVSNVAQVLSDPYMDKIKPGLTHDEVLRMLGEPMSTQEYYFSKEEAWEWNIESIGHGGQLKRFDVIFKDGKVVRTETRFLDPYECGMMGCIPN